MNPFKDLTDQALHTHYNLLFQLIADLDRTIGRAQGEIGALEFTLARDQKIKAILDEQLAHCVAERKSRDATAATGEDQ